MLTKELLPIRRTAHARARARMRSLNGAELAGLRRAESAAIDGPAGSVRAVFPVGSTRRGFQTGAIILLPITGWTGCLP